MKKKRSMSTSTKSYRASSTDMRGLSPNHPFRPSLPIPPARLANSSCQIDDPMAHDIKGKYVTAPSAFPGPHSSPQNCTIFVQSKSFRYNAYKPQGDPRWPLASACASPKIGPEE